MPILIEDEKITSLAERYQAIIHADSKQEAVRKALETVLTNPKTNIEYVERAVALTKDFNLRTRDVQPNSEDKVFMESLFGEN